MAMGNGNWHWPDQYNRNTMESCTAEEGIKFKRIPVWFGWRTLVRLDR